MGHAVYERGSGIMTRDAVHSVLRCDKPIRNRHVYTCAVTHGSV